MSAKPTGTNSSHKTYAFGEFTLDVDRGSLCHSGADIKLRPKSFEVLRYLVERHGQLVSKEELLGSIWRHSVVTDDAVTQCLIDVRRALDDPDHEKVRTLPRRGYIFDIPVEVNAGVSATRAAPMTAATNANRRTWLTSILAILLVVAAAWWGLDRIGETSRAAGGADSGIDSPTIAVLPFADMSPKQDQEYFADGISEQILNVLTQIPELRVIARTSSFSFKGQNVDIADIAERLNVTHVLEGSVRTSDNRIRITAQLIDASTSEHLWSEIYDRNLDDIFAIQDDISEAIVRQLKIKMISVAPTTRPTDPEAYRLYLLGLHQLNNLDWELNAQTEALLRQAVQIDPSFAPAWRELTRVLWRRVVSESSSIEDIERARETLKTALELDPDDPGALAYQAWHVMDFDQDINRAARLFEYAWSIGPTNEHVGRSIALFALAFGRLEDAIAISEYSVGRNPLCYYCRVFLSLAYRNAGQLDEAETAIRTVHFLHGGGRTELGEILLLKGHPEAALEAFGESESQFGRHAGIAMAMHDLGRPNEAAEAIAALSDGPEWSEESPWSLAQAYAWTEQADAAFKAIDRAVETARFAVEDGTNLLQLQWVSRNLRGALFQKLHDDPRWQPLLEKYGISSEQLAAIDFKVVMPE